jgi:fermentation-respiration switch protein FrsA (DUF1100 family)
MVYVLHLLLVGLYLVAPVVALTLGVVEVRRTGRRVRLRAFVFSGVAGVLIGASVTLLYAGLVGGDLVVTQLLLAAYFATGLLLILKWFDRGVLWVLAAVMGVGKYVGDREVLASTGGGQVALVLRVVVLFAVGLPYVMAAVMTYRPKVGLRDDPVAQLGMMYEVVEFESEDGKRLVGWWIPGADLTGGSAQVSGAGDRPPLGRLTLPQPLPEREGGRENIQRPTFNVQRSIDNLIDRTVIICHGLGANKESHLVLAGHFAPYGYNVLIFDFRAHGESGGQLTSFGAVEGRDVLAAVRWVRENRPEQAQRLFGVGASMGAAALIAAAADESEEGQSIEALVVYSGYDNLGALGRSVADLYFPPPLDWLAGRVAMPLASVQTGRWLGAFSPAELVVQVWPRPVMFIHGEDDAIVPIERGMRLYHGGLQPKRRLWLPADHNELLDSEEVGAEVRRFLEEARAVPVL